MAPGGRRWSESPIPRVAPRRVRGVGSEVAAPEGVVTGQFYNYPQHTDGLSVDMAASGLAFQYAEAGQVAFIFAAGYNTGPTAPSGWSVIASGTSGPLDYVAASLLVTGSDDWILTLPDLPTDWADDPDFSMKPQIFMALFTGPTGSITGIVTTAAASSSQAMPTPAGGLVAPWNAYLASGGFDEGGPTIIPGYDPDLSGTALLHESYAMIGAMGGTGSSVAAVTSTVTAYDYTTLNPTAADWALGTFGWSA